MAPRLLFALAPINGAHYEGADLKRTTTPVVILSGSDERRVNKANDAAFFATELPDCICHGLPKAGPPTFAPACTAWGRVRAPRICNGAWPVDRPHVHAQVVYKIFEFIQRPGNAALGAL